MSTLKITHGEPIKAATPGAAVRLAGFLFSDTERNTISAPYLFAIEKLGALHEHDSVGSTPEQNRLVIGEAVASLLCIVAMLTTEANTWMPEQKWRHRGPDSSIYSEGPYLRVRFAENMGRIAKNARAAMLAPSEVGMKAPGMSLGQYCAHTIHAGDGLDIYTYAACLGLSLRECFEAFAETRRSKLVKNAKRHGREVTVTNEKEGA